MSQIIHNTSFPNDGLGDPLRTAFGNQNTMNTELYDNKVDKVVGKGLTENDFTNALKAKLDGIAIGADVNLQPDWNQLDDTQDDYIKNKPDTFFSSFGYFHYADTATTVSPIAVVPDLAKKLTNDTLGAYTNIAQAPYGVTNIWNPTTNQFDLSDLTIGDSLQFRADILLTTTSANQDVSLYIKFGIGSPSEYKILIDNFNLKTITTDYHVLKSCIFSIDNDDWRDFPAEVYILSDDDATVVVTGWYIPIIRKSVNILDIVAIDETANHFKGDYNIVTNTPSLSNSTGVLNDEYKNTVAGTRDFGAGDVTVGVDDIIAFNGTVWYLKVNNNQTSGVVPKIKTLTSADLTTQDTTGFLAYADALSPNLVIASNEFYDFHVTDTGQIFSYKKSGVTIGVGQTGISSSDVLLTKHISLATKRSYVALGHVSTTITSNGAHPLTSIGTVQPIANDGPNIRLKILANKSATTAGSSCGWYNGGVYDFFKDKKSITEIWFKTLDPVIATNGRCFIGFRQIIGGIGNVNPSTVSNLFGIGQDSGDANFQIIHNLNKINLGASFPVNNTDMYYAKFESDGVSKFYYYVKNITTGAETNGSVNSFGTYFLTQLNRNNGTDALEVRIGFSEIKITDLY